MPPPPELGIMSTAAPDADETREPVEIPASDFYTFEEYCELEDTQPEKCPDWFADDETLFYKRPKSGIPAGLQQYPDDAKVAPVRGLHAWVVVDQKPDHWVIVDDAA